MCLVKAALSVVFSNQLTCQNQGGTFSVDANSVNINDLNLNIKKIVQIFKFHEQKISNRD